MSLSAQPELISLLCVLTNAEGMATATAGHTGFPSLRAELVGAQSEVTTLVQKLNQLIHFTNKAKVIGEEMTTTKRVAGTAHAAGSGQGSASTSMGSTMDASAWLQSSLPEARATGSIFSGFMGLGLGQVRGSGGSSSTGGACSVQEVPKANPSAAANAVGGKGKKKAAEELVVDFEQTTNQFTCR